MTPRTVLDLYRHDVEAPRAEHYAHWTPAGRRVLSTEEFFRRTSAFADALAELGVKRGDRMMLLCDDRPEWHIADLAVLDLGAADVPVYLTLTVDQVAYQARDSGITVAVAENAAQMGKLLEIRARCPALAHLVQMEGERAAGVLAFDELVAGGRGGAEERFWDRNAAVDERAMTTIIYTSGTTGEPKGVMLSHANLVSNVVGVAQRLPGGPDDLALECLPLCHVAERTAGYCYMFNATSKAYCSVVHFAELIAKIRPTVFFAVPRVYEKIYRSVMDRVAKAPPLRQALFRWALGVGREVARRRIADERFGAALALRHRLGDRLVLSKVRGALGGRVRACITGAAETPRAIAEFFHALGIPMLEAYGLTETSPVTTMTGMGPGELRLGTVGRPLGGVEVTLAPDGELLVRGPNVMLGYWNQPAETAAAIDESGWLCTGDVGEIDADGFVRIVDRKKEIIVTSGGKNVAPQPIEGRLKQSPFIEIAVLVGDRRPFVTALLAPSFEALEGWAKLHGIETADRPALLADPRVQVLYREIVDGVNAQLAHFEQVRKFILLPHPLSIDGGHLTPTLKLRRRVIEAELAAAIEEMYRA